MTNSNPAPALSQKNEKSDLTSDLNIPPKFMFVTTAADVEKREDEDDEAEGFISFFPLK